MNYTIMNGSSAEVLKDHPDNYFDSVVCDPPYLIGFLGKDWDHKDAPLLPVFLECLRVLKPGGHLLAFSAARTYHKLATSIEDAGFEIRDQIMWIYGSGFPKSQDVGRSITRNDSKKTDAAKQWEGWGTSLKPAQEPIVMARKPVKQSIAKNCQQYGTGALNIDACRIPSDDKIVINKLDKWSGHSTQCGSYDSGGYESEVSDKGRFPSNVIGEISEPYQKYFYAPKVSRKERHVGFDVQNIMQIGNTHPDAIKKHPLWDPSIGGDAARLKQKIIDMGQYKGNNHPTVKPQALMEYLCKLVTPPGGHILDPFNGSGSTGMAAVKSGFIYTGIELDPSYCEISRKRIAAWNQEELPPSDHFSYDAVK